MNTYYLIGFVKQAQDRGFNWRKLLNREPSVGEAATEGARTGTGVGGLIGLGAGVGYHGGLGDGRAELAGRLPGKIGVLPKSPATGRSRALMLILSLIGASGLGAGAGAAAGAAGGAISQAVKNRS